MLETIHRRGSGEPAGRRHAVGRDEGSAADLTVGKSGGERFHACVRQLRPLQIDRADVQNATADPWCDVGDVAIGNARGVGEREHIGTLLARANVDAHPLE